MTLRTWALTAALLALVAACSNAGSVPPPLATPEATPLSCASPCPPLAEEVAARCGLPGVNVEQSACGSFVMLSAETDKTSFIFTSHRFFYDASGKLVGRSVFVNEYGRRSDEGVVPTCPAGASTNPCAPKGG